MSETERVLKTRTEHHAAIMQKRRSGEGTKKTADKEAKVPKQQVLFGTHHQNLCLACSFTPCFTFVEWETGWHTCWCNGYQQAGLQIEQSGLESWQRSCCCVLGQDTLLSQFYLPRCINGYWEMYCWGVTLTKQAWSVKDLLFGFWGNFSCRSQWVVLSGQDTALQLHLACVGSQSQNRIWFILPTQGACHVINHVIETGRSSSCIDHLM